MTTITVNKKLSALNLKIAARSKERIHSSEVFCVNIMGAPGSGKTSFIEGISGFLGVENIYVIQGDLESDIDKKRLDERGVEGYQINTHSGCHLNAKMIEDALDEIDLKGKRYLLIENVGNLVCPAGKEIGQDLNVVVSSTAEGIDKPGKYPIIFLNAALVVVSKADIADAVDFEFESFSALLKAVNPSVRIVETSSKDGRGFEEAAKVIETARENFFC